MSTWVMAACRTLGFLRVHQRHATLVRSCHNFSGKKLTEIRNSLSQFKGGSVDLSMEQSTGVATVTINHPEKMNAFTGSMMVDFADVVSELEKWKTGKCLMLHGANDTFCSGGDFNFLKHILSPKDGDMMSEFMQSLMLRISQLPLVSAAVLQGYCMGGGSELAVATDFCFMAESAVICFTPVKIGVSTGWGGGTYLVQKLGRSRALAILLSGKLYTSTDALQLGLCQVVLQDPVEVLCEGKMKLMKYLEGAPESIHAIKGSVAGACGTDTITSLRNERALFNSVWGGPAHCASLEKGMNKKK